VLHLRTDRFALSPRRAELLSAFAKRAKWAPHPHPLFHEAIEARRAADKGTKAAEKSGKAAAAVSIPPSKGKAGGKGKKAPPHTFPIEDPVITSHDIGLGMPESARLRLWTCLDDAVEVMELGELPVPVLFADMPAVQRLHKRSFK
jgi:hypothetical protein